MIALAKQFGRGLARTGKEIWQRVAAGQSVSRPAASILAAKDPWAAYDPYDLRDLLLSGNVYLPRKYGGALKDVLNVMGRPCDEAKYRLVPHFNPFKIIVGFYHHALHGQFGKELVLAEEVPGLNRPPAPALLDPLARLWRWSNLDHKKAPLIETVANQGQAGIRVVLKQGATPDGHRVYLDADDPRFIEHVDLDERGNVVNAFLRWDEVLVDEEGNETERVEVREWLGKDGFSRTRDGEESLSPVQQQNPLGLCPYVLLRHDAKGRHAYHGSEMAIHALNYLLNQVDQSVVDHIFPWWFATSDTEPPVKFTATRHTVLHARTQATGAPPPTLDPLTPSLDFAGALAHAEQLAAFLREAQPQLIPYALSLLSGISGETLAQIRLPAESECLRARALYETGVIAAIQIGLSVGVYNGIWDLGTGTGTPEAAARAYDDGQGPEAFAFATRPALPLTPQARVSIAQAEVTEATKQDSIDQAAAATAAARRAATEPAAA